MLTPSRISRLAHAAPPAFLVLAVLYVVAMGTILMPGMSVISTVLLACVVVTQLVLGYSCWRHQRMLCPRCAAMTPLNCQQEAERQDRKLRNYHDPRIGLVGLALMFLPQILGLVFDLPLIVGQAGIGVALAITALIMQAWNVHLLLQPWCRYCRRRRRRWEDGGPREPSPDPAPSNRVDA